MFRYQMRLLDIKQYKYNSLTTHYNSQVYNDQSKPDAYVVERIYPEELSNGSRSRATHRRTSSDVSSTSLSATDSHQKTSFGTDSQRASFGTDSQKTSFDSPKTSFRVSHPLTAYSTDSQNSSFRENIKNDSQQKTSCRSSHPLSTDSHQTSLWVSPPPTDSQIIAHPMDPQKTSFSPSHPDSRFGENFTQKTSFYPLTTDAQKSGFVASLPGTPHRHFPPRTHSPLANSHSMPVRHSGVTSLPVTPRHGVCHGTTTSRVRFSVVDDEVKQTVSRASGTDDLESSLTVRQ